MSDDHMARMAQRSSAETNQLVTSNLDLVTQIVAEVACRYPRHIDRGKLWNAGALRLVEASRPVQPRIRYPLSQLCGYPHPWSHNRQHSDPRLGDPVISPNLPPPNL